MKFILFLIQLLAPILGLIGYYKGIDSLYVVGAIFTLLFFIIPVISGSAKAIFLEIITIIFFWIKLGSFWTALFLGTMWAFVINLVLVILLELFVFLRYHNEN